MGYTLADAEEPDFHFCVGENKITQHISCSAEGLLEVDISGDF